MNFLKKLIILKWTGTFIDNEVPSRLLYHVQPECRVVINKKNSTPFVIGLRNCKPIHLHGANLFMDSIDYNYAGKILKCNGVAPIIIVIY